MRNRGACPDGNTPYGGVTQGTDGGFYGAAGGAINDDGVLYRLTSQGQIFLEHTFDATDGSGAYGELLQTTDGSFYGSTQGGGSDGVGTLFNLAWLRL